MRPIIEFCTNNMHFGTDKIMKELEKNPEYDVIEYGCLGNCGVCSMEPYALVNGDLITAETPDQLKEKIETAIEEYLKMYDLDI
ncbi:YuzB family protein [Chengkuizengella axinellae]|uniref:YuzB family protein n=1 Tax=Chengkuizengella axinellae TaxID=3064388 RepID=A0ABT9ITA4_9BACL|nr:YuzB family protein [Chengkuizengella sp. 2205SS18-9]MDP5272570.1 YuzB family protein [Chengkuizengella sp. 2205SS18-9]